MSTRTIDYRGHQIRVAPDGKINVTDVAQALDMTRQQWYMMKMKHGDKFEGHTDQYRFDKRGPGATTLDREGLEIYLELTEGSTPEVARLRKALKAFYDNDTDPRTYQKLECENVLAVAYEFLNKLPNVPVELAEEFVSVRKQIQSVL